MGHGPTTFKETDLTRALRAARKAGADVERVEIGRDGRIVLVLKNGDEVSPEGNEWDEWRASTEIRQRFRKPRPPGQAHALLFPAARK
jgi:ATP-dependent exoDNAse (exonuclease V) alpha subunit